MIPEGEEADKMIRAKYDPEGKNTHWDIDDFRNAWWWDMWAEWFTANNLVSIRMEYHKFSKYDRDMFKGFHLLNGVSPRDREKGKRLHTVVGRYGRVWFDPHPERNGLLAIDEIELIVPLDPSKPILAQYYAEAQARAARQMRTEA